MGVWDTGIFDDDLAMDIKSEFEDYLAKGLNVKRATKLILENHEDVLEDEDESPIVYLSLAALQLEQGEVATEIRKKAIKIIESGQALERWEESDVTVFKQRENVLNSLKEQLMI